MNAFLERVGRFCARRHWLVLGAWLLVVAVLLLLRGSFGGTLANDYSVPGSQSKAGQEVLQKQFQLDVPGRHRRGTQGRLVQ